MNIDQLHQIQMNKLIRSFGVANAQAVVSDDRAARALGNHTSEEK